MRRAPPAHGRCGCVAPPFLPEGLAASALLIPGTTRRQRTATVYDAGFAANWELDFFGRLRRSSESAAARVEASSAGVQAALTSVTAEVARNYLELRGLQQRQQVATDSIANQRDALRLTDARLEYGRGTRLDVARAKNLLGSTEPACQHCRPASIVWRIAWRR
ncbi:MAG: TolC family protein [Pseudomonadota bacterium]|nr:TolC family protein [Pseudomonadota bacterium]